MPKELEFAFEDEEDEEDLLAKDDCWEDLALEQFTAASSSISINHSSSDPINSANRPNS